MAASYPIKGVDTQDSIGRPYVRRDIDQWYSEQVADSEGSPKRIQLTLFVRALDKIQKLGPEEQLSYFRLAGIHSAPWCEWDGEQNTTQNNEIPGFCTHNNYTFPTWHRAYMLLYEQVLHEAMLDWIDETDEDDVDNVPDNLKDEWKEQARQWRLPYWDFARFADRPETATGHQGDLDDDKLRLPILCMMPTVRVVAFDQHGRPSLETTTNPLYKYVTPKPMGEFEAPYTITGEEVAEDTTNHTPAYTYPWNRCTATTKYGILDGYHPDIWSDGGQNWLRANYALNEHAWYADPWNQMKPVPTLQDLVYRLFQYGLDSWGAFASTRFEKEPDTNPNAKNAMSLEFIHNNIHNWVGGQNFLRPDKNNMHLWGAGHMSSINMAAFDPIFFIYHNNIDRLTAIWQALNPHLWFNDKYSNPTKDNALIPFHKDEKRTIYKSDDLREWKNLHYDYEILQGPEPGTTKPRKDILDEVARLYGSPTKDLYDHLSDLYDGVLKTKTPKEDYVITVVYNRFALNGSSFKINLFLGEVAKKSFSGPQSENFVASVYNFSSSLGSSGCGSCHKQKAEELECIAQVPATVPIRHRQVEQKDEAPPLFYVVFNSLGKPIKMDLEVQLHKASRPYFKHPYDTDPNDPLQYEWVKDGKQADAIFE